MKKMLAQQATSAARDWLTLFLAGLGVTFQWHVYLGGMFFALAGASAMARNRKDPRKFWTIVLTGWFFATLVAVLLGETNKVPIQVWMGLTGLGSGWIMNFMARVFDRMGGRADDAADWLFDRLFPRKDNDEE